jgi:hypothetical protein
VGGGGAGIAWNQSAGTLTVRGAITATSGTFTGTVQAGELLIDSSGIILNSSETDWGASPSYEPTYAYQFTSNDSGDDGYIGISAWSYPSGPTGSISEKGMLINVDTDGTSSSRAGGARLKLQAKGSADGSTIIGAYYTLLTETSVGLTSHTFAAKKVEFNQNAAYDSSFVLINQATVTTGTYPILHLVSTWNSGGTTMVGLRQNITDTASATASLLLDLQVGGSAKFTVRKDGAIYERGRTTPLGEWIDVSFSEGNFTANGSMTWTVASGEQYAYAYTLIGKTMVLNVKIHGADIGGTANNELRVAIPGSFTAALVTQALCWHGYDAGYIYGTCEVATSGTYVAIKKYDTSNFVTNTGDTYISFIFTFEVA